MSKFANSTHSSLGGVLVPRTGFVLLASLLTFGGCYEGIDTDGYADDEWDTDEEAGLEVEPLPPTSQTKCAPRMHVFPVAAAHNIGYDAASCGSGTCEISCPDQNANSDWGGKHRGIDVFAFNRAPLVAVADGVIRAVGEPSKTSGLRVRLRDGCDWEYYYGHMDEAVVSEGMHVKAGDLIGYMGKTGTQSVHLHFNVSPNGEYNNDIDPFPLLNHTSPTACGDAPPAPPTAGDDPAPPPPPSCGAMEGGDALYAHQMLGSCEGRYTLTMQSDGNAVMYQNGAGAVWSTGTHGTAGHVLTMQSDGNLVLYTADGTPLWNSGTYGNPGAVLRVQDDGNLVIYAGSTPLWWTKG
jgi:hypothetical protein